ncbi:MAG: nucleoside monophosphate kinase [Oligoflexia bacterium]|nr:nucleoside monophosphate kinase [Oligoflexia bacterium]
MIAMIIGVPGSGRHTQGLMLTKHWNINMLSLRDTIHNEIINRTEYGKIFAPHLKAGEEIPNKVIYDLYNEILSDYDFSQDLVFAGFPVTLEQYHDLNKTLAKLSKKIDKAVLLDVPTDESIRRLAGRLLCTNCGLEYHTGYKPPKIKNTCDNCAQKLRTFEDDNPDVAAKRIDWFREVSASLVEKLEKQDILVNIDGVQSVETIHRKISEELGFTGQA